MASCCALTGAPAQDLAVNSVCTGSLATRTANVCDGLTARAIRTNSIEPINPDTGITIDGILFQGGEIIIGPTIINSGGVVTPTPSTFVAYSGTLGALPFSTTIAVGNELDAFVGFGVANASVATTTTDPPTISPTLQLGPPVFAPIFFATPPNGITVETFTATVTNLGNSAISAGAEGDLVMQVYIASPVTPLGTADPGGLTFTADPTLSLTFPLGGLILPTPVTEQQSLTLPAGGLFIPGLVNVALVARVINTGALPLIISTANIVLGSSLGFN